MLRYLRNLFSGPSEDFRELIKNGAQIVDVRSKEEFSAGHIKGSVNIPLQELPRKMMTLRKDKPVIVCCASGMRSSTACDVLKSQGYTVSNGGGWKSLEHKIK